MVAPAPLKEPPDFSLVLGGPLYQMFRRAHLTVRRWGCYVAGSYSLFFSVGCLWQFCRGLKLISSVEQNFLSLAIS
jgi:hypothetical protein